MIEFFITLIVTVILIKVLTFAIKVWRQVHAFKKQFQDPFGGTPFSGNFSDDDNQDDSSSSRRSSFFGRRRNKQQENRRHRKPVFSSTDGEYVAFEEIIEERDTTVEYDPNAPYEPQISDAKFEDIK